MMIKSLMFAFLVMLSMQGCGDDGEVFETLSKLRALGVSMDKLVPPPSTKAAPQIVTLTLHAVVPKGDVVTVKAFVDDEQKTLPVVTDLKLGQTTYKDYATLRYLTVPATFTVPDADTLKLASRGGAVSLRYGFLLTSKGEIEKVVGNVAVADPDSTDGKRTWKQPKIAISSPKNKDAIAKSSDVDVSATIAAANAGDSKIGWFTSSGKFKNRRAKSTVWESGDDAKQLLIATYREKRSRAFAIDIMEVKAK